MKTTVTLTDFKDAFRAYNRLDNFSYEALGLLFEHFEQLEQDTGEEIELCVVAICCEYAEDSWLDVANNYGLELPEDETEEEQQKAVLDYLASNTCVVGTTAGGCFVYQLF